MQSALLDQSRIHGDLTGWFNINSGQTPEIPKAPRLQDLGMGGINEALALCVICDFTCQSIGLTTAAADLHVTHHAGYRRARSFGAAVPAEGTVI